MDCGPWMAAVGTNPTRQLREWPLPDSERYLAAADHELATVRRTLAGSGPPDDLASPARRLMPGLDVFYAPYEGDGRRNAPYEPSMMVDLCLAATGTFSALDAVAVGSWRNLAFRKLAAGNFPQHRTVCESPTMPTSGGVHASCLSQVVRMAREMGLARFGKLSVDGTKATSEREQPQGDEP